ncbi:MAG: DUF2461 domain-containing protein [Flavobacteriales bacterium]
MAWFTSEFEAFFKELKNKNDKEWFTKNKKRFETHVKKPFEKFVADMILRMQAYDPQCKIEPKDAIFRIYRDVRFSNDKTPYKTQMTAIIGRGGRKEMSTEGMYIELGEGHARIYGGSYMPDKDQLQAIRQEILYNQDEFSKLIMDKDFKKYFGEIRGEQNKRLPAEFAEIQGKQPLIANKQFYYFSEIDPKMITSDKLIDEYYKRYEVSAAVRKFLITPLSD